MKVLKLFGRISGDITLFLSSKRRHLEARNLAVIFISIPFTTYEKTSFKNKRVAIGPEKFSRLSRNGPQVTMIINHQGRHTQLLIIIIIIIIIIIMCPANHPYLQPRGLNFEGHSLDRIG